MFKPNLHRDILPPAILGGVFILSRILYSNAGVRFDAGTITRTWHFIDLYLLKNDLWRSIYYIHTQPPLMNLLTGVGLQLFPISYPVIFHAFFLLGGLLVTLAIYYLGNRLGIPKTLSAILAAWFALSPATVVFEKYYFYTYPTMVLLTISAVFLARFLERQRAQDGLLFSLLLAANALTWSLFHFVWLLGCLGMAAFLLKGNRRKAVWLLPAFLLVFAWYVKNQIFYDSFTVSTWAGLNLFKTVTTNIPEDVREEWEKDGLVSELALVPPYRSPEVYLKHFPFTPLTGIPLLDDIDMSNGYRNQHHLSYVYAEKGYTKDAVRMLIHAPRYYLGSLPYSFYVYFHSASDYEHTLDIRTPINGLDTLWNRLFYGQWQKDESLVERTRTFSPDHLAWWLVLGFLLVLLAAPIYLWRQRVRLYSPQYGLILFMVWNVVFVSAAGILLDIGENNRTRFAIDPFVFLLAVFFVFTRYKFLKSKYPKNDG
jgi:hypothetical protein